NLFEEAQIVIADAGGVQAVAEFGIPRIAFCDLRDPLLRVKRNAGRQRGPEELATKHRITLFEDGGAVKPLPSALERICRAALLRWHEIPK
ncbi:MAG TPA: hypothetical protein VNU44_10870, partial [Bryobacteraceae bacterium]|nr:hypothetical protein [Bryobacteraceae bacterium]